MASFALNNRPTAGWVVAAMLAAALIGSWIWFLHTLTQPQPSQEQLRALAAQAAKTGAKQGRDVAPYRDDVVKNVIREHALQIQKPWLAYLASKPTKSAGAVTLGWTIAPDGKPTQVTVVQSDFEQAAFNEGVRVALAASIFPPPPGGQPLYVTHKLFFTQEPGVN